MPYAEAQGARLHYEEAGEGHPIVFVHEFAGDLRSWEPQMRHFSRRYRCIAYNARGYPPSDVPADPAMYSQDIATDDIAAVMRHLDIDKAHVVGLSMGGFATLHFGLRYAGMASALVVAGCGYGAPKAGRESFREEARAVAERFEQEGTEAVAASYTVGAARIQHQNKDPRGWAEFARHMAEHSAVGSGHTLRNVQAERPSLYDLEDWLKDLALPTLVVVGDEDEPALDASLYMKRTIPTSGLWIMPKTGHTINLEEPGYFNDAVQDFFSAVERGRWAPRDPRATAGKSILGMSKAGA